MTFLVLSPAANSHSYKVDRKPRDYHRVGSAMKLGTNIQTISIESIHCIFNWYTFIGLVWIDSGTLKCCLASSSSCLTFQDEHVIQEHSMLNMDDDRWSYNCNWYTSRWYLMIYVMSLSLSVSLSLHLPTEFLGSLALDLRFRISSAICLISGVLRGYSETPLGWSNQHMVWWFDDVWFMWFGSHSSYKCWAFHLQLQNFSTLESWTLKDML